MARAPNLNGWSGESPLGHGPAALHLRVANAAARVAPPTIDDKPFSEGKAIGNDSSRQSCLHELTDGQGKKLLVSLRYAGP
jgi:hypothetical protein